MLAVEHAAPLNPDQPIEHPALEPFHLSGKPLPPNLFLVRTRGQLPDVDGVVVHGTYGNEFLVSGDPAVVRSLAERGCAVMPWRRLPETPPPGTREWNWIDAPDPAVAAMVDRVRWEGVRDKIQWLADYGTRYGFAPNHRDIAESIAGVFDSCGLPSTLHAFQSAGRTMWNVEAIQVGTVNPDSYFIICGHYDSVSDQPMQSAPGADDNATGTAAVLTAAEILSRHAFEYSIRYVCFSGEELGLVGSFDYSRRARLDDMDIVGVLNFDMLGYWESGVAKDLEIETNQASRWLAEAVMNAADLYTDTPYELHVYDRAWWGDHWYFWNNGFAAVNHEEAWDWGDPDFNPYYHTTEDRLEHLDPGFTVGNIQIGVAALATLAGHVPPVEVVFDVRPGSSRNPFNAKSRGVLPTLLLGSETLDVHEIDVASLRLQETLSPSAVHVADMGSANDSDGHPCDDMHPDGIADLSLKFSTRDIAATLGPVGMGDVVPLRLTGRLVDGRYITGEDVVVIVGGGHGASRVEATGPPQTFALYANAPNPFNPTTHIRFDVPPEGGTVTLRVYDVGGRLVRTLVNGTPAPGRKSVVWDGRTDAGSPAAAGIYLYRLTGSGFAQTRKMVLLK